jgi:hypothetical protein
VTLELRYEGNGAIFSCDKMMVKLEDLRRTKVHGSGLELLDVMWAIRDRDCQDPCDKVYVALGMATDIHEDNIVPDYNKTYVEVYMDVVRFCISGPKPSLDFLSEVWRPQSRMTSQNMLEFEVPSWVPAWTK